MGLFITCSLLYKERKIVCIAAAAAATRLFTHSVPGTTAASAAAAAAALQNPHEPPSHPSLDYSVSCSSYSSLPV